MTETLILTRAEVAALLEPPAVLAALRDAFAARSAAQARRVPIPLEGSGAPAGASGMLLAPGIVPGIPAWSVKLHAKYPGQDPAIRGLLVLHDSATGAAIAVMESSHLTALRTGLGAALGAEALALPGASRVAIIGAGAQGRAQLAALRLVRPVAAVEVLDARPEAAAAFLNDPACAGLAARVATTVEDALHEAEVVVTATWAREPFLFARHLRPGMHVTTLGPDQPGKVEVAAEALRAARVVVDDRALALEMGAVGGAGLDGSAIAAELGEVLTGLVPGRRDAREVTVYGAVGLPFQDLAAGWLAYRRAAAAGAGRRVSFLD